MTEGGVVTITSPSSLANTHLASSAPAPAQPLIAATFPGELLAIEIVRLIYLIIEGQDPEVRKEHSRMWLEELKAWRDFWKPAIKP